MLALGSFLKSSFKVEPLKLSVLQNNPSHICYMYLQLVCDGYYIFLPQFKSWAFSPATV